MAKGRLALNTDGKLTFCTASEENIGKGRCNHLLHQSPGETTENFIDRVNKVYEVLQFEKNLKELPEGQTLRPSIELMNDNREMFENQGIQSKWYYDGVFYKEDNTGEMEQRNALSEDVACQFLDGCYLDHAKYWTLEKDGKPVSASKNFLQEGEILVDAETLLNDEIKFIDPFDDEVKTTSFKNYLMLEEDLTKKKNEMCRRISDKTGIPEDEVEKELMNMIMVDLLIKNNDRHLGNIGFIYKDGKYRFSPLFDHGSCLYADKTSDHVDEYNFWEEENGPLGDPVTLGMAPSYEYEELLTDYYIKHPENRLKFKSDIYDRIEKINCKQYEEKWVNRAKGILYAQIDEYSDSKFIVIED